MDLKGHRNIRALLAVCSGIAAATASATMYTVTDLGVPFSDEPTGINNFG
jgi:hypothetical protein